MLKNGRDNREMKHILVVGGSGMLRGTCLSLNQLGYFVTVIGRDRSKLEDLQRACVNSQRMSLFAVDYRNTTAFQEILQHLEETTPLSGMILWIRTDAVETLQMCLEVGVDSLHIRGIAGYKEPWIEEKWMNTYRRVVLGYKRENDSSRWLTNAEIAEGVQQAYLSKQNLTYIGQVEPYDQKPQ